jgi:hypothetical protein
MALEVGDGGGERTPKARAVNEKECETELRAESWELRAKSYELGAVSSEPEAGGLRPFKGGV